MERVTWIELADERGTVVARARLDRTPFVIGRGYASDLLVDDPQVCPQHLRLAAGADGGLVAEDVGSVNGVWSARGDRVHHAVVEPGSTLRIGRTTVRFRTAADAVAPTERAGVATPPARRPGRAALAAVALGAAAVAAATLGSYLDSYDRTNTGAHIGEAVVFALLIAGYAGIWAVVSRLVVHRFNFRQHAVLGSLAVLGFGGLTRVSDYLTFFAPDTDAVEAVTGLALIVLASLLLYRHLEFAAAFRRSGRAWITTAVVGGAVLLAVAGSWEEEFSSYPEFNAVVKPIGGGLVRRRAATEFVAGVEALAAEVDSLALKPVR